LRLTSSLPAGDRGAVSSVAGGQDPVLPRLGVTERPPLSADHSTPSGIVDNQAAIAHGGWRGTNDLWSSCV